MVWSSGSQPGLVTIVSINKGAREASLRSKTMVEACGGESGFSDNTYVPLHPLAIGSPQVLRGTGWSVQILFRERRATSLYNKCHVARKQMEKASQHMARHKEKAGRLQT